MSDTVSAHPLDPFGRLMLWLMNKINPKGTRSAQQHKTSPTTEEAGQ